MTSKRIFTTKDPIDAVLPEGGWLREYCDFSSGLEACTRFRFFTACCVLGAAINNKVWIHRGDSDLLPKLFPNPWVLLLAPPGRGHKTSTINMGVNILQQACPEVRLIADKITPEGLVKALSAPDSKEMVRIGPRDATGLVKAPELSVFFGKQTYNVGLVQLVTDLYDYREEWSSETIGRGKTVLKNNCISVLGGSTPDWLQTMLPQDAFEGGFLPRFVIVEMPSTYFKREPKPKKPKGASLERIVQGLRIFAQFRGEMSWTCEGDECYVQYYKNLIPTGDKQHDAYMERSVEQVIRVAMLLAIAEGSMQVGDHHMTKSKELLDFLMQETNPRIDRLVTHPRMALVQELEDILRQHTSINRQKLLNKVYRSLTGGESQFNEAIRILMLTGKVEKIGPAANPEYRLRKEVGDD